MNNQEQELVKTHRPFRIPTDVSYLWHQKGRENYIRVVKNMGIYDICECAEILGWKKREDSGTVGQKECVVCKSLIWPLSYVYDCDECTEPALASKFPVLASDKFICHYCEIGE